MTRALTFEESRAAFLRARSELEVPDNYMFSHQALAFAAQVSRCMIEDFCKANGIEPPPRPFENQG